MDAVEAFLHKLEDSQRLMAFLDPNNFSSRLTLDDLKNLVQSIDFGRHDFALPCPGTLFHYRFQSRMLVSGELFYVSVQELVLYSTTSPPLDVFFLSKDNPPPRTNDHGYFPWEGPLHDQWALFKNFQNDINYLLQQGQQGRLAVYKLFSTP